jgi:hypothetical protein
MASGSYKVLTIVCPKVKIKVSVSLEVGNTIGSGP